MKKLLLSATLLSVMSLCAFAEYQIDICEDLLPAGYVPTGCVADIGFTPGTTFYDSAVTGPSGGPPAYHFLWSHDDVITSAQPVNSLELCGECAGQPFCETITLPPYTYWYIPGPPPPPSGCNEFVFPDTFGMSCDDVEAEEVPTSFALGDAYPNPFNPSTTIEFALPQAEQVSLSVYNITGQQVVTLSNDLYERGVHSVTFDASHLGSGVYLYTLEAGAFTETKKMVLVK